MLSRLTSLARAARFAVAVGCIAMCTSRPTEAEEFPTRPIQLIVPFAAGGAADIIGRTIAEKLGQTYGQQVVVENKGGAGSNIGINAAAKSAPDGYTLVLASIAVAVNPWLFKSMPYDPVKDLTPLTLALETPNVVIVPASSPVKIHQGPDRLRERQSKRGRRVLWLGGHRFFAASGGGDVSATGSCRADPRSVSWVVSRADGSDVRPH